MSSASFHKCPQNASRKELDMDVSSFMNHDQAQQSTLLGKDPDVITDHIDGPPHEVL